MKPLLPIGTFVPTADVAELSDEEKVVVDRFHDLYYSRWQVGQGTISVGWLGYETQKCPLDLWIFQEIIVATKPEIIIECGTHMGGSALFLASICQLIGTGRVLTIDIKPLPSGPAHPLITYLHGSSTDPVIVDQIRKIVDRNRKVMVILDSDHSEPHVSREIQLYKDFVGIGYYLIVEDTNINGHPTLASFGPGPMEAVNAFISTTDEFCIDHARTRFLMTLNPGGYLKRVRDP